MKIIALILAVFVAFPNLGYSLASDCCSHEPIENIECHDEVSDSEEESKGDEKPCSNQCDCSCCQGSFLIKDHIEISQNLIPSFIKTVPNNLGTSFTPGAIDQIWQPPKIG